MATIPLDEILVDADAEAMLVIDLLGEYQAALSFWQLWSKCPDAMEKSGKSREEAERVVRERLKTLRDAVETAEPIIKRAESSLADAHPGGTVSDPNINGIEAACWPRWALNCAKNVTHFPRLGILRPGDPEFRHGPHVSLETLETRLMQERRETMRQQESETVDAESWTVPSEITYAGGFLARHNLPEDMTAAYKHAVRLLQSCCRTRAPVSLAWVCHDPCDVLQELESLLIDAEPTISPVMAEWEKNTAHLSTVNFHRCHSQTALGLCVRIAEDTKATLEYACRYPFVIINGEELELEGRDAAEVVQLRRDATADQFIRTGRITFSALEEIGGRLQKEILAVAANREETRANDTWSDYFTPAEWQKAWKCSETAWRKYRDEMELEKHPVSRHRKVRFLKADLRRLGLTEPE